MQTPLDEDEARMLLRLVDDAGLARWRWVRGAIRAAAADPAVARAIADAAPPDRRGGHRTGTGGARPGAGRPRKGEA